MIAPICFSCGTEDFSDYANSLIRCHAKVGCGAAVKEVSFCEECYEAHSEWYSIILDEPKV